MAASAAAAPAAGGVVRQRSPAEAEAEAGPSSQRARMGGSTSAEAAEAETKLRRSRHIKAIVFWQELRHLGTLNAPRPNPQTVLNALDERLDGPGYRDDDRHWADKMRDWAVITGWTGINEGHVLRARFRAEYLEDIDAFFTLETDPSWPTSGQLVRFASWPPYGLVPLPTENDGNWTWDGLFGWRTKTIEDWAGGLEVATLQQSEPLYADTYEYRTAKFEKRVFDKMAILNFNRLRGGPDPGGYKASARMGDYIRAVDAVIRATGDAGRERELDDEIAIFQSEQAVSM